MKGLAISDIISTALVLVIIFIILSLIFLINTINAFTSAPEAFVVSFIKSVNNPYAFFEGISHLKFRERQMFEHLLSASVVGSLEKGGSSGADTALSDFVGSYGRSIYIIVLSSPNKIFEITDFRGISLESISCGENAFCTDNSPTFYGVQYTNPAGPCQIGRTPIVDSTGKCTSKQTCCKYDVDSYKTTSAAAINGKKYDVIQCGRNNIGICNPKAFFVDPKSGSIEIPYCGNGFEIINDDGKCKGANNGQTTVCCVPAISTALEKAAITGRSEAPFLYKGRTLFEPKEYRCQDSRTEICNGEYVKGLCPSDDYTQCCITDAIRCKRPENNYFCRDNEHCPVNGQDVVIKDNQCPDPDTPSRQSNYECCTIEKPYNENEKGNNAGKVPPSGKYGSCYLTGTPYTDKPVFGKLEVSIG